MKDCVQWNPVYGWKYSHLSLSWTLNSWIKKPALNLLSSDHALNKNEILSSENVNQTSVPLRE